MAKECDAAGKKEGIYSSRDRSLLREQQTGGGSTNFGQTFPPYSRLADWTHPHYP